MNGSTSTPDILGLVNREITPEVIHRAALQLGEDDDRLRSALSTLSPNQSWTSRRGLLILRRKLLRRLRLPRELE